MIYIFGTRAVLTIRMIQCDHRGSHQFESKVVALQLCYSGVKLHRRTQLQKFASQISNRHIEISITVITMVEPCESEGSRYTQTQEKYCTARSWQPWEISVSFSEEVDQGFLRGLCGYVAFLEHGAPHQYSMHIDCGLYSCYAEPR